MRQNTIKVEKEKVKPLIESNLNFSVQKKKDISSPTKGKFVLVKNVNAANTKLDKHILKKVDDFIMWMDKDQSRRVKSPLKQFPQRIATTRNISVTSKNSIRSEQKFTNDQNVKFWG